nr:uncharacterized protein LOC129136012 [Pan troglodytes]
MLTQTQPKSPCPSPGTLSEELCEESLFHREMRAPSVLPDCKEERHTNGHSDEQSSTQKTSVTTCEKCFSPPPSKQSSLWWIPTGWPPIQLQHYLPGDSIRSHRLRALSPRPAPTAAGHQLIIKDITDEEMHTVRNIKGFSLSLHSVNLVELQKCVPNSKSKPLPHARCSSKHFIRMDSFNLQNSTERHCQLITGLSHSLNFASELLSVKDVAHLPFLGQEEEIGTLESLSCFVSGCLYIWQSPSYRGLEKPCGRRHIHHPLLGRPCSCVHPRTAKEAGSWRGGTGQSEEVWPSAVSVRSLGGAAAATAASAAAGAVAGWGGWAGS